ncbi:MAG: PIG-L family deacetylase [Armatimonadota bacterium]|nr:PIG-L family deacetylase [Armatimonadota bacterium]
MEKSISRTPRIAQGETAMGYQRILVFGAHPDDELAMAPTMAMLADGGVEVYICIATNGSEGYPRPEWRDEIVQMRAREMEAADEILGTTERICIGADDMGLTNDKPTFKRFIEVIRRVRPDAIFTHGPHDSHRDHLATHEISVEAAWQAGNPVASELGEVWRTRYVFFYKAVADRSPDIILDVSDWAHVRPLTRATQNSQHTLWHTSVEELEAEAERLRRSDAPFTNTFWLADRTSLSYLPPLESDG